MNLQPMGISNRLFYYLCGGDQAAFDICFNIDFTEELQEDLLEAVAARALANFPELAIRPVIHEGTVWTQANEAPVPLLPGEGPALCYGTEDTNGYVFAFRSQPRGFLFSYFHGLTDFHGIWSFLRTVLYYYAQGRGLSPEADQGVRMAPDKSMDELERLDPYRKFAEAIKGQGAGASPAAFAILEETYPVEEPSCFGYELRYPLQEFLAAAKAEKTSVAALISLATARGLEKLYEVGEQPLVTMLSAGMHKYYQTATAVNFSDATFLRYDEAVKKLPREEQGAALKAQLRAQMNREHFVPLIAGKVAAVDGFTSSGLDIFAWHRRLAEPSKEPNAITFPLTYPGSFDLSAGYQSLVREINRLICIRGLGSFGLGASTYGDTMYIRSCQRFDSPAIMEGLGRELAALGLSAELRPLPRYCGNQMRVSRLLKV